MTASTIAGLQLGAPGIYPAPEPPDRSLRPVRLDVAGFAGVAPRGPVDWPVLVRSWTDYRSRFGGFEQNGGPVPGRLPYAVKVFFDQGGERAYVVRIGRPGQRQAVADDTDRALLELTLPDAPDPVRFVAANPGTWGNSLSVRLEFNAAAQFPLHLRFAANDDSTSREIVLPAGLSVPGGSLLRVRGPGLPPLGEFRWVDVVELRELEPGHRIPVAVLDRPVPRPDVASVLLAGVVTGTVVVSDGDRDFPQSERLTGLGLDPTHPRWLADEARRGSLLIRPLGGWITRRLPLPNLLLTAVQTRQPLRQGRDVDEFIDGTSFFDDRTGLDVDDGIEVGSGLGPDENPHRLRGATSLANIAEIGLLAVPDLFWGWHVQQPPPDLETARGSATFTDCSPPAGSTAYVERAAAVLLDARSPAERDEIVRRQATMVDLAHRYERFVVLLDVPPHLDVRGIARWRAGFDSSYAAAYHPWLGVVAPGTAVGAPPPPVEVVPPSAFAAGIIAARERRFALPWGPANELAAGAVFAAATISNPDHDVLHSLGVNIFREERGGYRLTAARTLARDRYLRQLTVRRLLTMIRLALYQQMQWVVFEPSTPSLRELLRLTLLTFLRGLYLAGAFVGGTENEAFFVRVGDDLNPSASVELGRLVVEVGVAPAEPIEFILLRITRDGDGGVRVEERTANG